MSERIVEQKKAAQLKLEKLEERAAKVKTRIQQLDELAEKQRQLDELREFIRQSDETSRQLQATLKAMEERRKEREEQRKKRKRELSINRRTKAGRRLERENVQKRTRVWDEEEKEVRKRIRARWYELCDQKSDKVWSFDHTRNDDRQVPLQPEWKKGFRIVKTGMEKPRFRLHFNGAMRYCYCCHISPLEHRCCYDGRFD